MTPEVEAALKFSQLANLYTSQNTESIDSVFKCVTPVPIPLSEYAIRLGTYLHCSDSAFYASAIICHRLHQVAPRLFCARSIHKIVATCSVVGAKFVDDRFFSNTYYGECAGVSLQEMNIMELCLLKFLDFKVFVANQELVEMKKRLHVLPQITHSKRIPSMVINTENFWMHPSEAQIQDSIVS